MTERQLDLPDASERLVALIETSEVTLESTSEVLKLQLEVVRAGDRSDLKKIIPAQSELAKALRQAVEIERSYHDYRTRLSDELAPGEIDFDILRNKIREQLGRLREKVGSRGLPERSEE